MNCRYILTWDFFATAILFYHVEKLRLFLELMNNCVVKPLGKQVCLFI